MKIFLSSISIFILVLVSPQHAGAKNNAHRQHLDTFLQNTKSGDVDNIYSMLTDPLRSKMQKLLKENKGYKKMLRDRYRGARFEVNSIEELSGSSKIADVTVFYSDGSQSAHKFVLKEISSGKWKISDEIFK